jgi:hypothetical protein
MSFYMDMDGGSANNAQGGGWSGGKVALLAGVVGVVSLGTGINFNLTINHIMLHQLPVLNLYQLNLVPICTN